VSGEENRPTATVADVNRSCAKIGCGWEAARNINIARERVGGDSISGPIAAAHDSGPPIGAVDTCVFGEKYSCAAQRRAAQIASAKATAHDNISRAVNGDSVRSFARCSALELRP